MSNLFSCLRRASFILCASLCLQPHASVAFGGKDGPGGSTRPVRPKLTTLDPQNAADALQRSKNAPIPKLKDTINTIDARYVPPSGWLVAFEVGRIWTPWYCETYFPAPPGQPATAQRCLGQPKDLVAMLRVRLDGHGKNAGKTMYVSGTRWGDECAGTVGDTCKLVMTQSRKVTILTDGLP